MTTLSYIRVGQELFVKFVAKRIVAHTMKSIRKVDGLLSVKDV